MTQQEVLDQVRSDIGCPSTTEFPDTKLIVNLNTALREYSKYRPKIVIGVFQSVADTQRYELYSYDIMGDDSANFLSLEEVFYNKSSVSSISEEGLTGFISGTDGFIGGINASAQNSLLLISDQEESLNNTRYNNTVKIINRSEVFLIPTPTEADNVYFTYSCFRRFADITENEIDDVLALTFGYAAIALGNQRQNVLQVSDAGGFVMFFGGKQLVEQGNAKLREVRQRLGISVVTTHG